MAEAVARQLVPTVYTEEGLAALSRAVRGGGGPPVAVHLKVDTGMHRVGADASEAGRLADRIAGDPHLELGALWTHLAVADGADAVDREFTEAQLERFDALVGRPGRGRPPSGHDPCGQHRRHRRLSRRAP